MQYLRITRNHPRFNGELYKCHILKNESSFLCGLGVTQDYEEVGCEIDPNFVCVSCQKKFDSITQVRKETFRTHIARRLESLIDVDAKDILSELETAASKFNNELSVHGASCKLEITYAHGGVIEGRYLFDTSKYQGIHISFVYKSMRVKKLRFESAVRYYLYLFAADVL